FFQAEDGIRDFHVTGVQTCALPILSTDSSHAPKVGFVSLGCPKALVDSEQILTQLRAEGYETAKSYDGADLVIVNTCGFIDAAEIGRASWREGGGVGGGARYLGR